MVAELRKLIKYPRYLFPTLPFRVTFIRCKEHTSVSFTHAIYICMFIKQAELIMDCLLLLPHADSLLACAVTHSTPTSPRNFAHCLQESYFSSVRSLLLWQGKGKDRKLLIACKHGNGNRCYPSLFPLRPFWEEHHGLQQPLAKSHNSALCKRQGQPTTIKP